MVFFFPKIIETRESSVNGKITVSKLFGSYSIHAGGFTQSGGLVRSIWRKAVKTLANNGGSRKDILILGLGAGSAAKEIAGIWPEARMIGVELDPLMIELGKRYFALQKIPQLTIVKGDAFHWVFHRTKSWRSRFDCILCDLYVGGEVPQKSMQGPFLTALRELLINNGVLLVNHLIKQGEKGQVNLLEVKLSSVFAHVERIPTPANIVFSARK